MFDRTGRWQRAITERPTAVRWEARDEGKLLCVGGPDAGKGFRIEGTPALIGRDPFSMVQLTGTDVSRRQARIVRKDGKLILEDYESRNGMLVNGTKVAWIELRSGDTIQMGSTILIYTAPRPEARAPAPRRHDSNADTGSWT